MARKGPYVAKSDILEKWQIFGYRPSMRIVLVSLVAWFVSLSSFGKTLFVGNGSEPNSLDPHLAAGTSEENILINLFEGLVTKDPETLKIKPGVAEKWSQSKDGKTLHFHLRKNAQWSDGTPVTAQDFVYAWRRLLDPKTASEYAQYGVLIKGAKAFHEGKGTGLGIAAPNPHELIVTLEAPTPYFLGLLEHFSMAPLPQKTVEEHKDKWTRPENLVSNGAFSLKEWKPQSHITIQRNAHYWEKSRVRLDDAKFFFISDLSTEEKMFRAGQLHVTREVPLELGPKWKGKPEHVTHPYLGVYFYALNTQNPLLTDVRLRRALSLGLDRKQITLALHGNNEAARTLTPPGTGGYDLPPVQPKSNERLNEAKALLKQIGAPIVRLELLYNTHPTHQKVAEVIQQMWKKNLGIDVTLVNQEWKVVLDRIKQKQYAIARRSWIANYDDPLTFLELFEKTSPRNNTGFANVDFDQTIEQARIEQNRSKRKELFQKAERMLSDETPVIPIYFNQRTYLKSTRVSGWSPNREDKHALKYVDVK